LLSSSPWAVDAQMAFAENVSGDMFIGRKFFWGLIFHGRNVHGKCVGGMSDALE